MIIISLVIVNYNGQKFLERLLSSIGQQTLKNFEVILVDNDSKDDSIDFIIQNYPNTKIVRSANLGYGTGCNIGAKNATGRYLVFLNEDMYLPSDFLGKILAFRESLEKQEKIGSISCKMVDFDDDPEKTHPTFGGQIDWLGFPVKNMNPEKTFVVSGSPFFISRELFLGVKGFNELIFIYGEDVDLSWRLNIFGYKNFTFNGTYIHHYGGGATGRLGPKKVADVVYGGFIPLFTNYSLIFLIFILPLFFASFFVFYLFITLFKFDVRYILEIIRKNIFFFKNIKKALLLRRFVQKNRVKSDFYLFKYLSYIPAFIANRSIKKFSKNYSVKNY